MPKPVPPRHTPEQIARAYWYDEDTGYVWKREPRRGNGLVVGAISTYQGASYQTCRLAWCLWYGEWPPLDRYVDHKDGCHHNDKINNLRLATASENNCNVAGRGRYAKGVSFKNKYPNRPWVANITRDGRKIHIGNYATEAEAADAFRRMAEHYQGEFAHHNRPIRRRI